ncbi:MAG: sigma 54-interacting transcriptional regulator [Polyangiaceae bacterium]|nr:sigma 54-interacting transcriptional regulator [Polyangiaceae bacterium]
MNSVRQESTVTRSESPPSSEGERSAFLCVVHSPIQASVGQRILLPSDGKPAVFGRDVNGAGAAIPDRWMSRLHFRVAYDRRGNAFRLGDANSRNGTWVNGERAETQPLNHGDVIRGGDTLFVFEEQNTMAQVKLAASQAARSPFPILLSGETGAGKERMAQFIHAQSQRPGSFVPVNCAVLPRDLLASEFFGHVKGAFSGAGAPREGLVTRSHEGTLFLDEIGDLPLDQQPALLRVLQEGTVRPIGSDREIKVDLRVIAATNVDLEQAVRAGRFREDLFGRLAQLILKLPPLRERKTDVLMIAEQIGSASKQAFSCDADVAESLLLWDWPRNIRELQSLVHSLNVFSGEPPFTLKHLLSVATEVARPLASRKKVVTLPSESPPATHPGPNVSRKELQKALQEHQGNIAAVSKQLGLHRTQLYRWLEKYGLDAEEFR